MVEHLYNKEIDMKKILSAVILSLVLVSSVFALKVYDSELKSAKDTIEFINYTGPHKKIETLDAIKGIGKGLGKEIAKNGISTSTNTGNKAKYYVIHAVDPKETGKLDADILYLGSDAQVDHIKNLRYIISAYLQDAYGYSEADADTLSVFITVYNAVYRGNLDYYSSKYKNEVTKNLTSNAGLSVKYSDWPGKSEILIPLYDVSEAGLSTVDTSVISDTKVVESMKEDEDRNIDSRKEMVDIKEREAEQAQQKANEAQKKATEEQKKLKEEQEKTAKAEKAAEEAKKEAEEAQKAADENPENKELQKEAAEKAEVAENTEKAAEEQREKEAEQQEKTDDARQEAADQQAQADKKETEALNERKEIAKDQNEVMKEEARQAKMDTEYGIMLVDEENLLSRLVKFDTATGETVKNSPVAQIRNRTAFESDSGYIAIAGENSGNGTVKLVNIDPETMEIALESTENVAEDSVLVQDGSDFYCVIDDNGKYVLAKYNENMELRLKSPVTVKSATPVMITKAGIVVTNSDGKMQVLGKEDLAPLGK